MQRGIFLHAVNSKVGYESILCSVGRTSTEPIATLGSMDVRERFWALHHYIIGKRIKQLHKFCKGRE